MWVIFLLMIKQGPERDWAAEVASSLRELTVALEKADEVFRRFRMLILEDPLSHPVPTEWIPISNH
jgi:hypothetical protein